MKRRITGLVRAVALLLLSGWLAPAAASAEVVASQNGVSVARGGPTGPWTVSNGVVTLSVGFDARGTLAIQTFAPDSAHGTLVEPSPEAALTINGRVLGLGTAAGVGTRLTTVAVEGEGSGLRLDLTFTSTNNVARITRSYACYPLVPVIEVWTTVAAQSASMTVASPTIWRLSTSGHEVSWIRGLQAPEDSLGSFALEQEHVAPGEIFRLEAQGRSTESALPWFVVTEDGLSVFGGLMWSGRWAMTFDGRGASTQMKGELADVETQVRYGRSFTTPRGFLGVVVGGDAEVAAAMRTFATDVVREGRGFEPLVTYNTWFAYGTHIDASLIAREIETAAKLGVELFQLDAGWYEGSTVDDPSDFSHGLGDWHPDPERFPDGIRPLVDHAHGRGLRFGLWVEPERVDLATVGRPDLAQEAWLATADGHYDPGVPPSEQRTAQICLAHPAARQWLLEQLTRLIEEDGIDHLKWDNNAWVRCNRSTHGHGSSDGDVAHVLGLYEVLAELRTRFPSLLIENCSGGGNRIDLGLARYTDVAWMDDRSAPSSHVRHNLEGLSSLFPPAYLLSYAMSGVDEPLSSVGDLEWLVRSRMLGVLGFTYRSTDLTQDDIEGLAGGIDEYRRVRAIVRDASAALLTAQVSQAAAPSWDATMAVNARGEAVVFAFRNDAAAEPYTVFPVLLLPDVEYEVRSIDGHFLARASGSELMNSGIDLRDSLPGAQVVLLLPDQ